MSDARTPVDGNAARLLRPWSRVTMTEARTRAVEDKQRLQFHALVMAAQKESKELRRKDRERMRRRGLLKDGA